MTPAAQLPGWEEHVRAIRAAPDDASTRLACAEWLQSRGDPRGELIAIELRLAGAEAGSATLRERRHVLLGEHRERWLAPLRALGAEQVKLERGFVWSAQLSGHRVGRLGAICRIEPVVQVQLSGGRRPALAAAAGAPELALVRRLQLDGAGAEGLEEVLASPLLTSVEDLLVTEALPTAAAAALAEGVARPRSALLQLDRGTAWRLAGSPCLERLERLCLWRAGDEALVALARAPLAQLRALSFWESKLGGAGLSALGERLDRLEELESTAGAVDNAGIDALVRYVRSGRLRRLVLNGYDPDALAELVVSPALDGVERLELPYAAFNDRLVQALVRSPHRRRLRSVWCPEAKVRFSLPGVEVDFEGP